MKLDNPDLTTIVPMSQPNASVMHIVIAKAVNGVASPRPNGKPHFNIMAMDIPAKAIIGPMDKSNSPEIINKAAPTAIIPNWAIMAILFFKPKALKAFPSDAKPRANIITIMTMKEPISGLLIMRWIQLSF
jgi:hypothetical protein